MALNPHDIGESPEETTAEEGGLIPSTRRHAYSLQMPADLPIPVLIAVPHAGREYPEPLIGKMRHPEYSKIRLEDRFVDRIAKAIARQTGAGLLIANAPRAIIDLNRATDDVDWDMIIDGAPEGARHSAANRRARSGLGLVPRRLPGLGEIWKSRLTKSELTSRIRQIHVPYHAALSAGLRRLHNQWGAAILLDLHSMPPLKVSHPDDVAAQFVIGDRFGATVNDRLVAGALRNLAEQGRRVAHNRPYAGGYVLDRHAAPNHEIHAIQVEVCRSLYLSDDMREITEGAQDIVEVLTALVRTLGEETARLGNGKSWRQAAE